MFKVIDAKPIAETTEPLIASKESAEKTILEGEPKVPEGDSGTTPDETPTEGTTTATPPDHVHPVVSYDELNINLGGKYTNDTFEEVDEAVCRIVETTDGKYIGTLIPNMNAGDKYIFDTYVFEVVNKVEDSTFIILSNSNYIIRAIK